MIVIPVAFAFLLAAAQQAVTQQAAPQPYKLTPEQMEQARQKYEPTRQAVIHLNELAGNIHSEDDARAFVDAVAERMTGEKPPAWTTPSIRRRVAHAEYEAVSDPARLVPEQRVADVWNEYVRELDAPEETLVTVAEVHNLRDGMYSFSQLLWNKGWSTQMLSTVPGVFALGADGKVANGCRAVEALKIMHDMFYQFQNVRIARERVQKGVLVSDRKYRQTDTAGKTQLVGGHLDGAAHPNPLMPAEMQYVRDHGERDYDRLLERLFAELFPAQ